MVTEHQDCQQASASQLGHPSTAAQAKSGAPGLDMREGSPRTAEPWPGAQTGTSLLSHGGPPDTFMGIPPERNHFVDFQGPGPTGTSWASLQGAILHLGQEVLGKGAAHIEVVTILEGKGSRGWRQVADSWLGNRCPVHLGSAQHLAQTSSSLEQIRLPRTEADTNTRTQTWLPAK